MDTILIEIEKPVYGGYGLGHVDGKTIFVPFSLPGETCEVTIREDRGQYAFAELHAIRKHSPKRIVPECPAFGICGGCSYLHTDYSHELELKKDILADTLKRTAHLDTDRIPPIDIVYSNRSEYRSHITVKVRDGKPGYFLRESNEHVPVPPKGCLLAAPELNSYLLSEKLHDGDLRISMSSDHGIITSSAPAGIIQEHEEGILYNHDVNGFFQANRFLRSRMLRITGEMCSPHPGQAFLDIGCGCGFFSLYLAKHGAHGCGFDVNRKSIEMARHNAEINGIKGITFEFKPACDIHPGRYNANIVIADPPRAGLDKRTRKTISAIKPEKLIYVSCDPSTFARDCGYFTGAGYRLKTCTLIDMFPGTYHIEVISCFERL